MFFRITFALKKNGSRVHKYLLSDDPTHFPFKACGKRRIQVASDKLKVGETKGRLNSAVKAGAEPASILFHKLHFIKIRE